MFTTPEIDVHLEPFFLFALQCGPLFVIEERHQHLAPEGTSRREQASIRAVLAALAALAAALAALATLAASAALAFAALALVTAAAHDLGQMATGAA